MIPENQISSKELDLKLSNEEKLKIYNAIELIPKTFLDEITEDLYDLIIENADKRLKKHILGRTIFHLYSIDRIGTYIGLEKLIHAGLMVCPELLLNKLKNADASFNELVKEIERIIL